MRSAVVALVLFLSVHADNGPDGSKLFLEENQKKDGVITLASGLQYKVLQKGHGEVHPTKDSFCEGHYVGTLIDGTEFDNTYTRALTTRGPPRTSIKGVSEAMQNMVEGDKWELYIPSELAYGDRGLGPIPAGAALIFQMELLKVGREVLLIHDITAPDGVKHMLVVYEGQSAAEAADDFVTEKGLGPEEKTQIESMVTELIAKAAATAASEAENGAERSSVFLKENQEKDGVITLASGLQYKVLHKGRGKVHPTKDSYCESHYVGTLIDGTEFDSTHKKGVTNKGPPKASIKGFSEAMENMVEGDKWELYIPSELAYGDRGSGPIPAGAAIIFELELLKIGREVLVTTDLTGPDGVQKVLVVYKGQSAAVAANNFVVEHGLDQNAKDQIETLASQLIAKAGVSHFIAKAEAAESPHEEL